MAARVGPSTPLRNRYTHGEDPIETRLPSGRCNYTNLSSNGTAPVCGCRRFWDKALAVPGTGFGGSVPRSQTRSGFCMCGHHACYHDDNPQSYVGRVSADVTMAEATPTIPQKAFLGQASGQMQNPGHEVGRQGTLDTLQWGRYTRSESVNSLPAIPSQCLLPSDTASITSGSQAASIRPSGIGRTFNPMPTVDPGTASGQQSQKDTRIQMYEDANGNLCMQSLTEAATPSARASQDPVSAADLAKNIHSVRDALGKYVQGNEQLPAKPVAEKNDQPELNIKHGESLPGLVPVTQHEGATEATLIPRLRHLVNNLSEYPTKIQNHETRLGLLENTTFHHPEIEDLHDADDRLDNRVCEIEERIRDVEKAQAAINDASSVGSRQIESFDSRVSATSSAMIVSAMNRLDFSRLEALEAQIAELRAAALPSHSRPWEVEVVFLPFGSRLMGIWSSQQSMSQRSRVVSSADDSWTQSNYLAAAQACLTAHDQSSAWERSATNLSDQDPSWLMARACGVRSRVDERLRSRGLVKRIRILGPDARDVQAAILQAFKDLPDVLVQDPYTQRDDENSGSVPRYLRKFLGLSASWIPLRKIHKDSCLRYLNPSEMITPALWTVPFLTSSVAMRHSGVRRLYVTQRDSYIQKFGANTAEWTWQKLRQLPRVYPDQDDMSHIPEADAIEPCWEFDERLDPPYESTHSSFASDISSLSIRSHPQQHDLASPSDHFSSAAPSPNISTTPKSIPHARPISSIKERNPFRPLRVRTTSMPLSTTVPIKFSEPRPSSKRRIASVDRAPSPSAPDPPFPSNQKRRRTRSPSRPQHTPRYSNGSSSPFNMFDVEAEHNYADKRGEEGMTPLAYATPHSNAPYFERAGSRSKSSIGIYEDEDISEQAGRENSDDELDEPGSATDEFYAEGEEEGYEKNYISEAELRPGQEQERQAGEEWEGVEDKCELNHSAILHSRSLPDRRAPVAGLGLRLGEDDGEEDKGSDVSSVPSEYPSRQPEHYFELGPTGGIESSTGKAGFMIHVDEEASF
ncbi:hypothetical protein QTJ16_005346 [Diplocarpon rosae]|uniref:Uncharacterized protein n=1 Tax=Diplocarpon rosae TaxID=946125 RepID=A0AAD9WB50_9HELO|nr:hypothetical protein QTJ16_005346 [Diplocarpon rosae]